jgi:hypothetical protein
VNNSAGVETKAVVPVVLRFFAYPQGTYVPLILETGVLLPVWFSLHRTAVDNPVTLLTTNQVYNGRKDISLWKGDHLCLLNEQEMRLCLGRMIRVEVDPRRVPMMSWDQYMFGEEGRGADADDAYRAELRRDFEYGGIRDTHRYFVTPEQVRIENWRAVEVWDTESRAWCSLDGLLLFYKIRHLLALHGEDLQISVVKLLDDLVRVHESRGRPNGRSEELIASLRAVQRLAAERGDGASGVLTALTLTLTFTAAGGEGGCVRTFDELGLVLNDGDRPFLVAHPAQIGPPAARRRSTRGPFGSIGRHYRPHPQ